MFADRKILHGIALVTMCGLIFIGGHSTAWAVSTHFTAVANEQSSNSDSRSSITFYDASNMGGGPLFSVQMPFEGSSTDANVTPSTSAFEEISAMQVDPSTGDVYVLAFDNFNTATDTATQYGVDTLGHDTTGDYDLYKINFQTVLNNWKTNFEGKNARSLGGALTLQGPAPVVNAGGVATSTPPNTNPPQTAADLQDYITYGVTDSYSAKVAVNTFHKDASNNLSVNGATDIRNANGFVLNGAVEKIGEINKNRYTGSSNFFNTSFSMIDSTHFFQIDDARQSKSLPPVVTGGVVVNDNDYRIISQVSAQPGQAKVRDASGVDVTATDTGRTAPNGGFNHDTTQSWESRRIDQAMLDTDETNSGSFLSEMQTTAYYTNGSNVKGAWVVDRDRPAGGNNAVPDCGFSICGAGTETGDDVAFLKLDGSNNSLGYQTFSSNNATKFDMDNDPAGTAHGPGHIGQLFTATNGDIIVVEEGFTDSNSAMATNPNGLPVSEPAVIRGAVNYDDSGKITITWGPKMLLNPAKNMGDTFVERGYFSGYDPVTNKVYFAAPGGGPPSSAETPNFEMAYYVMDVATGVTSSYLNLDESVSLFFGATNDDSGQKVVAFSLPSGVAGDYNNDGTVDAADYTVWRDHLGQTFALPHEASGVTPGTVTQEDYDYWKLHFGEVASGAGNGALGQGAVPEPTSVALLTIGLVGLFAGRRRFGR